MPRPFPVEFRRRAVALVRAGKPVTTAAVELAVSAAAIHNWVKQDQIDRGERPGATTPENVELAKAKRRIRQLLDHPGGAAHRDRDLDRKDLSPPAQASPTRTFDTRRVRDHHEPNPGPRGLTETVTHPCSRRFLSRMISDTAASSSVLTTGVCKLLAAVVTFAVAAVLMATIDPILFALSMVITVVATVLSTAMGRLVRSASGRTQAATATLAGSFVRTLTALPLIRAYGVSGQQLALITADANDVRTNAIKVARLGAYMQPVITLATQALLIVTLALGGVRVAEGSLSLGGLIAFMMYLMMMVGPVSQVGSTFVSIQTGLAAIDRVDEIVSALQESDLLSGGAHADVRRGGETLIELENVTFEYPQASTGPATRIGPLDIAIREGEHVALVLGSPPCSLYSRGSTNPAAGPSVCVECRLAMFRSATTELTWRGCRRTRRR